MKFRLIPLREFDAYTNMALDEAICESIQNDESIPVIRFYTWKPSAVSIGYFQGLKNEVNIDECKKQNVDVVRRRTGGGAVYHDEEITYSIIGPVDIFPKDIIRSYEKICQYIVYALAELGIDAKFSPINDIVVDDKKISGNAQTRRDGILLQHGTILYDVDVDKMFSLLKVPDEKTADKLIQSVKKRVTRILDYGDIPKERVVDVLYKSFSKDKEITVGNYTKKEIERAKELVESKYNTERWNNLR